MAETSRKRLAEHFRRIEALCDEGWWICRESPEYAERWAAQHSEIGPACGDSLPSELEKAVRYCRLHGMDQTIGFDLNQLRERACRLIDSRPIQHFELSNALFLLCEFANGHREELDSGTPENIDLIPFNARQGGADSDEQTGPFVPTPLQVAIVSTLDGKALKKAALANAVCKGDSSRLYKRGGLKELVGLGKVAHKHGVGYYRPDAPPPNSIC